MGQKISLSLQRLLLLFLGFSLLLSSVAVPTTRIFKSTFDQPSAQDFVFQDVRDLEFNGGDLFGRFVLENNDYPGTGANNHHDPNTPAKP
ncbi:hypothetical protein SDJN03_20912, partial [Cucurbita argyrosperma subsp. sororia]